jgi:hypothetical protein
MNDGNSKGWSFDAFETWVRSELTGYNRAIDAALVARKEEAVHHNGLIDQMKDQQGKFVTRGQLAATIIAAVGGVGTLIGVLNYFGGGS